MVPLLLLAVAVADAVASAPPSLLRVGVFEGWSFPIPLAAQASTSYYWQTNYVDNSGIQIVPVNFLIAQRHFNERRGDILPVLGEPWVKSCPTNISIPYVCNTEFFVPRPMRDLQIFQGMFDALAGFDSSTDLVSVAPLADVLYDLPIVDHWSSSPVLEDRSLYPKLLRTGQDDGTYAVSVVNLLVSLGYNKAVLIYLHYDSGPAFKDVVYDLCFQAGIDLRSFQYTSGDAVSLYTQVKLAKETQYNVILFYGYATDYSNSGYGSDLPGAAAALNMTGDQLWIFMNFDGPVAADTSYDANVSALFTGALRVTTTIPDNKRQYFDKYSNMWDSGAFQDYIPSMNRQLPPFGAADDFNSCINDNYPFQLNASTFFNETAGGNDEVSAYAYDAIIILGLAACLVHQPAGTVKVNGTDLVNAMYALNFTGMSGDIIFDPNTGGRLPQFQTTLVQNWQHLANGTYVFQDVGIYEVPSGANYSQGIWKLSYTTIQFPRGFGRANLPLIITPPPEDKQYLISGLRILGYVEIAMVQVLCAVCWLWMLRNRSKRVVVQSQPVFMYIILFGCCASSWSILGLVVDDNPASFGDPTLACNAAFSLFPLGYVLAMSALAGKTYRVWSVFHTSTLHTGVSVSRVMQFIALVMAFTGGLVLVFQLAARAQWVRSTQVSNVFGFPLQSIGQCLPLTTASQVLVALLFVTFVLSCVGTLVLASAVRKAPEEFLEARYTTLALTVIIQVVVVGAPVVFATYSSSVPGRFIIMSFIVFFCNIALIGFLFFPKMYRASRKVVVIANAGRGDRGQLQMDIVQGLRIPRVKAKFEKFAAEQRVLENMHFLCDIDQFRATFDHSTEEVRRSDALALAKMYIVEGSLLEVNISDDLKQRTMANVEATPLEATCFDDAAAQVAQLCNWGVWGDFVDSGGLYGIELDKNSPVMGHKSSHQTGAGSNVNGGGTGSFFTAASAIFGRVSSRPASTVNIGSAGSQVSLGGVSKESLGLYGELRQ